MHFSVAFRTQKRNFSHFFPFKMHDLFLIPLLVSQLVCKDLNNQQLIFQGIKVKMKYRIIINAIKKTVLTNWRNKIKLTQRSKTKNK